MEFFWLAHLPRSPNSCASHESQGRGREFFTHVFLQEMPRLHEDAMRLTDRSGQLFLETAVDAGHDFVARTKQRQHRERVRL